MGDILNIPRPPTERNCPIATFWKTITNNLKKNISFSLWIEILPLASTLVYQRTQVLENMAPKMHLNTKFMGETMNIGKNYINIFIKI